MQESHIWFNKAVARWLDIALYKAMQRIIKVSNHSPNTPNRKLNKYKGIMSCRDVVKVSKTTFILLSEIRNFILDFISPKLFQAVELDDLSPVDDLVKHSSSAVDIRTVLMQVIFTI